MSGTHENRSFAGAIGRATLGVSWHVAKYLVGLKAEDVELGETVTIGRQNLFVPAPKLRSLLQQSGTAVSARELDELSGNYVEPLLTRLGAKSVDSIDASDYEQATLVRDMNQLITEDLHERFDTVFDGGTIEHVFDIKLALHNEMSMVRRGGNLIIATMANNWLGHGFYQFSPELFYRVLSEDNGFRIKKVLVHEAYDFAPWYEVPDPKQVRSRIELSNNWRGVDIIVHAVREEIVPLFRTTPQQSDYAATWADAVEPVVPAPAPSQPAAQGLKRRIVDRAKTSLPGLLAMKHDLFARYPWVARLTTSRRSTRYHKLHSFQAQSDKFRQRR